MFTLDYSQVTRVYYGALPGLRYKGSGAVAPHNYSLKSWPKYTSRTC